MIWEFYKYEDKHGKKATAYDIDLNGRNRSFVFVNDPMHQRQCHCQKCDIVIPREVPRIKLKAQYYYGSGYYCMSCGIQKIEEKISDYDSVKKILEKETKFLNEILDVSGKVFEDDFYEKKMAMARMLQVMAGKDSK